MNRFRRENSGSPSLTTGSNNPVFQPDDIAILEFLEPQPGRSGTAMIQPFRMYHDRSAGDFVTEILTHLDTGKTVILDLGNANPQVMQYFSDELSKAVFNHQVDKFSNNRLGDHFIQLYFEEAHNLFPRNEDVTTIYSRFAKEGAKYHIGMVYSTQSPTTINKDLLAQTENFFIAHVSSRDEVVALGKLNVAYDSMQDDILCARHPATSACSHDHTGLWCQSRFVFLLHQQQPLTLPCLPLLRRQEENANAIPSRQTTTWRKGKQDRPPRGLGKSPRPEPLQATHRCKT